MELAQNLLEGFLNPDSVVREFGIMPGIRIADFGSGAGHIAILVAQKTGQNGYVIALDIMEDKLESIKARARASGLENIETRRANLEVYGNTEIADETQDMVLLVNILFQSTKKPDILKEAKRVLKFGGTIIVVDWKKGVSSAQSGSKHGFGPPDELRTDPEVMQSLFTEAGFTLSHTFDAGQFHYGIIFKK